MQAVFTSLYTHNRERSKLFGTTNNMESKTQQSDKDDSDINVIVGRFFKTGQMPQVTLPLTHGDFTNGTEFRDLVDQVRNAQQSFDALPKEVKKRFDQDPAKFIDFATDPANLPEMKKMGLAIPDPTKPEPVDVRVLAPPA